MYVVNTTNAAGNPIDPQCGQAVEKEGYFCSPHCFETFHLLVFESGEPIDMPHYLDLYSQPWYGRHHG